MKVTQKDYIMPDYNLTFLQNNMMAFLAFNVKYETLINFLQLHEMSTSQISIVRCIICLTLCCKRSKW